MLVFTIGFLNVLLTVEPLLPSNISWCELTNGVPDKVSTTGMSSSALRIGLWTLHGFTLTSLTDLRRFDVQFWLRMVNSQDRHRVTGRLP